MTIHQAPGLFPARGVAETEAVTAEVSCEGFTAPQLMPNLLPQLMRREWGEANMLEHRLHPCTGN